MSGHIYIVRKGEQPELIAQALGIDYNALMAANKGGKDAFGKTLRQRILGRDMRTKEVVTTFLDADWKEGIALRLPANYSGHVGEIPAGAMGVSDNPGDAGFACSDDSQCDASQGLVCSGGVCISQDIINQCTSGNSWWDYTNNKCVPYTTPLPQTDACSSSVVVKAVQQALLDNGQSLPKYGADGSWGCESQAALDASGQDFMYWANIKGWGGCSGSAPHKSGCGTTPVPSKCKNEGDPCAADSDCCTGGCVSGKCAAKPTPVGGKTSGWVYAGIGLALALVVGGVAYAASGDDKKGQSPKAEVRPNPGRMKIDDDERELWVMNDEGWYNRYMKSGKTIEKFIKQHRSELDSFIRSQVG